MTKLIVMCAWCGRYIGEKDGGGTSGVSHGICEDCAEAENRRAEKAREDKAIADNLQSYWRNLNSGSARR